MVKAYTPKDIEMMAEGGAKLATIRSELAKMVQPGATPLEIEKRAQDLIKKQGGRPSFQMVKNYRWATCININAGVVHGVPTARPFVSGDIVSIDVGMFYRGAASSAYKGFHTDTSVTIPVDGIDKKTQRFLRVGYETLNLAIRQATAGNRISDISKTIQNNLEKNRYSPVRALTGHGIGRKLHEEPQIPCFWDAGVQDGETIPEGAVLAIEVIYTAGSSDLVLSGEDGWTIATKDGKIAGLFEETVAVTSEGPRILTA